MSIFVTGFTRVLTFVTEVEFISIEERTIEKVLFKHIFDLFRFYGRDNIGMTY